MAKKAVEKSNPGYPFSKVNNLLNKLSSFKNFRSSKKFYLVLLILGLFLLVIFKKNLFIAALVNGTPITNLELQMKLNEQFRTQTLNQLTNEKIILDEARKNNALATDEEITKKIQEIETSVGGAKAMDEILSSQGQDRNSIKNQIRLQLSIEKLYSNEATVSALEVDKFLETNRSQLRATDSAKQVKEAEDLLKQQKLSKNYNEKLQTLRQQDKI
ncbi:MAG: SurA N-terminal domain-containing protein, partial [Candidatus Daviesbacteria bacterium]|nr:SurA N-terminal domain-containing protein [Candidatus Daviesbacteria bacterium]